MGVFTAIAENLKLVGGAAGGLVALGGGYVYMDAPLPATTAHVESKVAPLRVASEQTKAVVHQMLVVQIKKDKADLFRERFQWSAKMKELPETSPARADYEWRVRQIDDEIKENERKLETLERTAR